VVSFFFSFQIFESKFRKISSFFSLRLVRLRFPRSLPRSTRLTLLFPFLLLFFYAKHTKRNQKPQKPQKQTRGLLYGMVLTNARAVGEFGAVAVVSGNIIGRTQTLTLFVESAYKECVCFGAGEREEREETDSFERKKTRKPEKKLTFFSSFKIRKISDITPTARSPPACSSA